MWEVGAWDLSRAAAGCQRAVQCKRTGPIGRCMGHRQLWNPIYPKLFRLHESALTSPRLEFLKPISVASNVKSRGYLSAVPGLPPAVGLPGHHAGRCGLDLVAPASWMRNWLRGGPLAPALVGMRGAG